MQNKTISGFQLSPQQKRLWLLQQNSSAYVTQCAILIEGNLLLEVLKTAIEKIINRHEIIRTSFYCMPGVKFPVMVVEDSNYFSWQDIDLSHLHEQEQSAEVEKIYQQVKYKNFDLEQAKLLHLSLLKLSADRQILLIGLPALCADTWTIKNLFNEIITLYSDILRKEELDDEAVQYCQFSEWQNQLLVDEDAEAAKEYWCQQEIASLATLRLPFERKSVKESEFTTDCVELTIAADLSAKIGTIAQNYHTSSAIILLACWQTLIWRLTGQTEIIIGTACDRREYEELYDIVGLLATWIPIKSHLTPDLRLKEVWELAVKTLDDTAEWQDYFVPEPIEKDNNLAFGIGFEFEEFPEKRSVAGVTFSLEKLQSCIEPFKVKLVCNQKDNSLTTEFYYDINYFSADTIQRLAGQFQTLLNSVVENPDAPISQLKILGHNDYQKLLVEFNQTYVDFPEPECIHLLFEAQVSKTPNNIAVVYEDQQLTYAELNHKANQLAHYLQQQGVKPEVVVGLYVERSLEMIIGLLGILKAGGAYLPLDPMLPKEGLSFRLQDTQAPVLLTQQKLFGTLPTNAAWVICLDTDWEIIAQKRDENPNSQTTSENLAYVLFTSGSTGKPKGVAIEHRQLFNYINAIVDKLDLPAGTSFATVSSFAADLGNTTIFPSLCTGGCLHVISQERVTNPEALANYCDRHPIDCIKIVPSHLNALLSATHPQKILPRKYLILGGEALSWNLVEKIQQYAPNCQILNHYGPTEATVGVLTYLIEDKSIEDISDTVPLGNPLANTQVYILDNNLQPLPFEVPGELYIGGSGLARGYINQPELTNEKFIRNPLSDFGLPILDFGLENTQENLEFSETIESQNPKSKIQNPKSNRLYKTGDLARYLPNGNIEFLGRIDDQVKIRGFRIELAEIESTLREHPTIRECTLLARADESGNQRLVAYVVPNSQHEFAVSDLRNFLKQKLPEYMIPSAFVRLKALPLTPNGKVDRRSLPEPDSIRPELEQTFVAPRTPIEETIAKIWAQVLELERVGINDNFFELGGDSIMIIQIAARANQGGLQMTPKQMFEYPTVASLATVVDTSQHQPVRGLLPLAPMQGWFFEQHPEAQHWNQTLVLEVREVITPARLSEAMQHLLQHHQALRLRLIPQESAWQEVELGLDKVKKILFTYVDLSGRSPKEQETTLETTITELQASLNLAEGLLLRVALFNLGDNQPQRLVLVIHHLVADSVSWRILLTDLQQTYQKLTPYQPVEFPPKTSSFQQWCELVRRSDYLQQEGDYLHQSQLRLPVDNYNDASTVASVGKVLVSLGVEETKALLQEVPKAYRTKTNEVLLTALAQTFNQWTQRHSLMVDVEGEGREIFANQIDLSRTVGCLTTLFPVILNLEGISQPAEALKVIKEQLRKVPNQGISYGLQRYLKEETQLSTLPQAEVRFRYLDLFDAIPSKSSLFQTLRVISNFQINPPYLLDINAFVIGEQLQLEWNYNTHNYQQNTIEKLAQQFIEILRSLINHCQSTQAVSYTPSDFPKAKLNQKDLDKFLAKVNRGSERKDQ